jgi:hypothetical protein
VRLVPLQNQCKRSPWELAGHNAVVDPHRDLELTLDSVEMRGLMIPVQYGDYDAKEAADLGHEPILPPRAQHFFHV